MNPAVVAPDAFDIVELSLDKGLTVEQRRNLGSIAKVLHHASANKLVSVLNGYSGEWLFPPRIMTSLSQAAFYA